MGRVFEPSFSKASEAHAAKRMALETSRLYRGVSIDSPLGVFAPSQFGEKKKPRTSVGGVLSHIIFVILSSWLYSMLYQTIAPETPFFFKALLSQIKARNTLLFFCCRLGYVYRCRLAVGGDLVCRGKIFFAFCFVIIFCITSYISTTRLQTFQRIFVPLVTSNLTAADFPRVVVPLEHHQTACICMLYRNSGTDSDFFVCS